MRIWTIWLLTVLIGCGSGGADEKSLKIACAANMQVVMDSLVILFEQEHNIHCDITSGSSGMLTAQIENGAPYDVFVSANISYPENLFKNGEGEEPVVYAQGRLVLAVNKTCEHQTIDEVLQDENYKRIGIADQNVAPYGVAANQYLEKTKKKITLTDRLVIGESVSQVNQYIATGAVDAGFTSYSFKAKNEEVYKYFEVDPSLFDPINQGVMILDHGLNQTETASRTLLSFLSSSKSKEVLNYFGYLTD